jgi:hypothetical protein
MMSMHFIWLSRTSRRFTFAYSSASCCTASASFESLSEGDVVNKTNTQFKSYAGSDAYDIDLIIDLKALVGGICCKA